MRRIAAVALLLVAVFAGRALGFDAVGTVLKVDTEKRVLHIHANGQDRAVSIGKDAKVLGADGKALEKGLLAEELKNGAEVTVTVDRGDSGPMITVIRMGRQAGADSRTELPLAGKATVGFKPLTEMTAADRYKGEDGGLYGEGRNEPPEKLLAAAKRETAKIAPLDADGKPADNGAIALVSISMSNATQEFSMFKEIADKDDRMSSRVTIVDCAQGGQAMAQWVDPKGKAWLEADRRLAAMKVSPAQVQVVWIKLANVSPTGDLAEHGKKLRDDTVAVIQNARARFPNLRIAYLGSRIYGGYGTGRLNPEPYAYEGAFVVRWLIQGQIKGDAELRFEAGANGTDKIKAPLLLWGPYFWADGTTPRQSDKLIWERTDFAPDGIHPSNTGRRKVADMLLNFFTGDAVAKTWFIKK